MGAYEETGVHYPFELSQISPQLEAVAIPIWPFSSSSAKAIVLARNDVEHILKHTCLVPVADSFAD